MIVCTRIQALFYSYLILVYVLLLTEYYFCEIIKA